MIPGDRAGPDPGPAAGGGAPPGPRLLPEGEALAAAARAGVPEQLARLNVFRLLLRRPATAKAASDLLLALLAGEALDHRRRELVIMRIAWTTGSGYEWAQHWRVATALGVPEADLRGVRRWEEHGGFDTVDRMVLAAVDDCVPGGAVDPGRLRALHETLGEEATVELLVSIGLWTMVSTVLRSAAVPLEDGVAPWPPDGVAP